MAIVLGLSAVPPPRSPARNRRVVTAAAAASGSGLRGTVAGFRLGQRPGAVEALRAGFFVPRRPGITKQRQRVVQVHASFLGVGAPEAVMVGIVALVVFGPKGLAEAAKSLGKAARSLQPTIKELAEVSSDLKQTIEDEIGLDEIRQEFRGLTDFSRTPTPTRRTVPLPGEEGGTEAAGLIGIRDQMAKEIDPEIDEKRAAAAAAAWGAPLTGIPKASLSVQDLDSMSIDELKAEIARRKAVNQEKEG